MCYTISHYIEVAKVIQKGSKSGPFSGYHLDKFGVGIPKRSEMGSFWDPLLDPFWEVVNTNHIPCITYASHNTSP